jgi:tetratricopeptide (TPR) repeat protein
MKTLERFLEGGFATPEQIGPMNQQLAAWYNGQKNMEKTLIHYRAFIDATPDASPAELATMGSLYLQADQLKDGIDWVNRSIAASEAAGEAPDEVLFQRLDGAYVELDDRVGRLNNLEALIKRYPKPDYYSRLLAIYANSTNDDRTLMINAYRLAMMDVGLATVGEHLGYADTALVLGSPGEALNAMEKGMAAGIVPSAGSNQEVVQEAKAAVARDRRDLPKDSQAAAKDPKGEFDVKVGLGFYSLGEWEKSVEAIKRGLAKGGVKRQDDANMLLGAALVQLGRYDEAKQAFAAAAAAAGTNEFMRRLAGLWTAYADRRAGGNGAA